MLLLQRLLVFIWVLGFASGQVLSPDEVESLKVIAKTIGKTDWNFDVDPCSGSSGWAISNPEKTRDNAVVTCNCSFSNNTVCHVTSIVLREQNLRGSVPRELTRLPFLQEIDLARNYLEGVIPPEWGSMKLVKITLLGNRLTGPIPKELGNISTLANMTLEYNELSGTIPPELGNLYRLERLLLTSNNLVGEIPETLANLSKLYDFRISDNNFTGHIPNFIQNWTNMRKMVIQASGLTGPIPSGIASLTKLIDLRISDLSGNNESAFPPLSNLTKLMFLILRSCNIVGQLPSYIGDYGGLDVLDLSFNRLSGSIPDNFNRLSQTGYIYLTGNSLSGPVPPWMLRGEHNIDLSYNNFTFEGSDPYCQQQNLNLFASSEGHTSGIASCLSKFTCRKKYSSVHINCGGKQVVDGGATYEDDTEAGKPAQFFQSESNWAYSSTGHFLDDDRPIDFFIESSNLSIFGQNFQVYKEARLSPLSLTYYAFCLMNGDYTVNLDFAEIIFTNDNTFTSLGKRVFDVYIQGKLVLKDFNIANEAGGVNKGLRRDFTAVVDDETLEIRFYWAGKGTIGIPHRGVYGPLISAISIINSNLIPSSENGNNISLGAIVGIGVAVLAMLLVLSILWWKGCLGCKYPMIHDHVKDIDLDAGLFSLIQVKAATNNFDPANKIGEGGFGPVYKGHLSNGTVIAVKQLSSKSKQGIREFVTEVGLISALQHPHLLKFYGCCIEGNELMLMYEYMENNSVARALFGPQEQQLHLDWPTRHNICIGIARGLAYLHEESKLKIVHRDIKATNVLLDGNLIPKISDFGLAKLYDEDKTHISTRVAGTYGYMAPEYVMRGHLTYKADVYSFGVVLLEIVSGRSNNTPSLNEESFYLLDWADSLKEKGNLLELVDPRLESNYNEKEVMIVIKLALLCTNAVAVERPTMSTVVSILDGKASFYDMVVEDMQSYDGDGNDVLIDVPWTTFSTPTSDLYPVTFSSDSSANGDPLKVDKSA